MEGSQQQQPPFDCTDDRGILETLVVPPKDDSGIHHLLDVEDGSVFYGDFHLPEFPCMSSSSSSSSTTAPAKPTGSSPTSSSASLVGASASSSSATSWAMLNHDAAGIEEMENRVLVPVGSGGVNGQSEALASTASMEIILEKPFEEDAVAAAAAVSGTSSSAAPLAMSAVDECMGVMEDFGYMELLEGDDMFDPTSIFQSDNLLDQQPGCFGQDHGDQNYHHDHELVRQPHAEEKASVLVTDTRYDDVPRGEAEDDMGAVFLEWLRANRDSISVEDLRKVKIKKSTIEMAARRLGGGKEAMKKLLKLILEWVQTNHLPRKYAVEPSSGYTDFDHQFIHSDPNTQPVSAMFADPSTFDSCIASRWASPPPMFPNPGMDPSSAAIGAYMGGEPMDFPMVDSSQPWPSPVPWSSYEYMENFQPTLGSPQGFGGGGGGGFGYPSQYPLPYFGAGSSHEKFTRMGSSATKEARKKRMARQRRLPSHRLHHHRVANTHRQDAGHHDVAVEQPLGFTRSENYCTDTGQLDGNANWMYWPPSMQGVVSTGEQLQVQPMEVIPTAHPPAQIFQRPAPSQQPDRRPPGWKPESNLKFLLQKVLKQSDVGNLGRIVLPKKEAETHLPELEARDGISIAMEDIVTSRVWNMRYRFWPNNKSRMYLLENTGDFVRTNGLQEGDFIVIYSDVKCGKYLIRGVKVRQPEGTPTAETKRSETAAMKITPAAHGESKYE